MWSLAQTPDVLIAAGTLLAGTAAFWGAYSAHRGVTAWPEQLQWQQGRDVAIRLRTASAKVRRTISRCWSVSPPRVTSFEDAETARSTHLAYSKSVESALGELALDIASFEWALAEAEVIWGGDYSHLVKSQLEVEHWVRVALHHGSCSIDPSLPVSQRNYHDEEYHENYVPMMFGRPNGSFDLRRAYGEIDRTLNELIKSKGGGAK